MHQPLTSSSFHTGLTAALPISEGATTSRVVVNNDLLRVVCFAMDAGQELTEHSSPRAVVVVHTEGELDFTIDGKTERLTPGDVVYMAPGARHALVAVTPSRFVLTLVACAETSAP